MDAQQIVVTAIIAMGTGGLVTAVVAARKAGAEKQSIIVDAAQGAVVVQQGVIESLREQIALQREELKEIHATFDDVDRRLQECEEARDGFERELERIEQQTELDHLGRLGKIERREQ